MLTASSSFTIETIVHDNVQGEPVHGGRSGEELEALPRRDGVLHLQVDPLLYCIVLYCTYGWVLSGHYYAALATDKRQ